MSIPNYISQLAKYEQIRKKLMTKLMTKAHRFMPDKCFAYIDPDGFHWLPHHYPDGIVDIAHLQSAIIAVKTTWQSHPAYRQILSHLELHTKILEWGNGKGACIECIAYPCNVVIKPDPNESHWCAGFQPKFIIEPEVIDERPKSLEDRWLNEWLRQWRSQIFIKNEAQRLHEAPK